MPRQVFLYDPPDRFVIGTVGQPGQRAFFLQATGGGRVTSVALEKEQVALLAERVDELLDEVLRRSGGGAPVPAIPPGDIDDTAPLDQPILEEFRVGAMALAWDAEAERVVIEAQARVGDEDEGEPEPFPEDDNPEGPDLLRVRISGAQARAFAQRALSVVGAGRPSCPFCGLPIDAEGHICPRQNGHRHPTLET
ncbi:MAG: DUF3090 domain-containing protein [Streptomycetales bacterium]